MRRYSATLVDVADDLPVEAFELPTSSLIPCQQGVTFSFVVPGHRYLAKVRGYDRRDLRKQRPGSPHAVDSNGQVVAPRWTTECGAPSITTGEGGAGGDHHSDISSPAGGQGGATVDNPLGGFQVRGVTSAPRFTVYADYCRPLIDHAPTTDTALRVGLQAALRTLSCGSAANEVFEFTAELEDGSSSPVSAGCQENVTFSGLNAGQDYRIEVLAFEQGADQPRWQTTCRATALPRALTPASCDPLTER